MNVRILALVSGLVSGSAIPVYSCTCGGLSIEKEVDRAFDIVIGKVTSERSDDITCEYSFDDKTYDFSTTFAYSLAVEFSY